MGNDGGSIPTRRELVKQGAKDLTTTQVKEIQTEQQEHYWKTCALSHEPLTQPVVSDGMGTLYNKAAVLDHLLSLAQKDEDKDSWAKRGEAFKDRIRSLRDVVEVIFEVENGDSTKSGRWVCPVTSKAMGPGTKAIYLVPCGHAFAESVVKEMRGDVCLQCNASYSMADVVPILPTSQAEKDVLALRLERLKVDGLSHSLKKLPSGKKRKKVGPTESDSKVETTICRDTRTIANTDGIKNADTASLTAKVLAEQDDRNKRRRMASNSNVKSLFSSKNDLDEKRTDFMTRGFSIPANSKR